MNYNYCLILLSITLTAYGYHVRTTDGFYGNQEPLIVEVGDRHGFDPNSNMRLHINHTDYETYKASSQGVSIFLRQLRQVRSWRSRRTFKFILLQELY
jgi:hypothetical protein